MDDFSATGAPARIERRRRELLEHQERLACLEARQRRELHRTRSDLDQIADKLDDLTPRADAQTVLRIELERMRLRPQDPPVAHSGWSTEELTVLREVYSMTIAERVVTAAALVSRPIDADTEPTDPRVKAIIAAAEKAWNLGK
jgi:hypothetical protein